MIQREDGLCVYYTPGLKKKSTPASKKLAGVIPMVRHDSLTYDTNRVCIDYKIAGFCQG